MNVYDVEVNGLTLRFQLSSEDVKRFKGAKKVDLELERIEREAAKAAKADEVPVIEDGAEFIEGAEGEDPEAPNVEAKPAGKTGK